MVDLSTIPPEHMVFTLIAVYERSFDYEDFCRRVSLDPKQPESVTLFDEVHESYADLWKALGDDEFATQIELHQDYIS